MALIKTIGEIKEVLPKLVSSISEASLKPNFDRTEEKYIVPVTGRTLYNTLVAAYNANTLSAEQTKLVKHLRLVIAAYAYKDELGLSVLTIGDGGVKKNNTGNTPVYGWEVQRLENTLLETALDGMEVLLNYLFDNKASYAEWTASEPYSKIKTLLIRTATDFTDQYTLFRPQRSYFVMKSVLKDTQFLFIEKTIGAALLTYLRDKEAPTSAEKTCIELLKKSLAFYTVMKACRHFSVSFSDGGFTIMGEKSSNGMDNGQGPDLELLQMKMNECDKEGSAYLELARTELVALYSADGATSEFKTAFEAGDLVNFIARADRTSGNESRKIFVMP